MNRRAGLVSLFVADVVSVLGGRVTVVAIPWLVLQTTGSPTRMGLVAAAEMLPYVLSGILAAPLADRWGLRRTSILTDVGSAAAMAAVAVMPDLTFAALMLLMAAAGALRGLGDRVKHVLLRPMADVAGVPMLRVTSAYEGLTRTAMLVGAPLGGVLVYSFGPTGALWVDAVSFAFCAIVVAGLVRPPAPVAAAPAADREPYLAALRAGARFLRGDRLLLGMLLSTLLINIFSQAAVAVYVPVWVNDVLGTPAALGLAAGALAGGAVLGNLVFTVLAPRLPPYRTFLLGVLLSTSPRLLALGLSHDLGLVLTVTFLSGLALAAVNPIMGALLYERVPDALQTRVFGLAAALSFVGIPLGALFGGVSVDAMGLGPAIVTAAGLCLIGSLVPLVRHLRRPVTPTPAPTPAPAPAPAGTPP